MRAGWQSKSFESCIEKVTYTTKIQRKDFLDTGVFPVVSQEDAFINGYWDAADDVFRVETPLVVFGDHTKVLKYIDFDFVLGADGVKLLLPKEFLVPKFFYYQLQTAHLDSLGYARHYKLLKELQIKYPDRAEQHRIVALLDDAFDGIATAKANAEKNLQNARALFESHLQSVFTERGEGWMEKRLGDIAEVQSGGTPTVSRKEFWNGDIPWYSSGELNNISTTNPDRHITAAGLENSNAKLFPRGALLIGMYDTAALKMSILDRDGAFNQAIAGVKPNNRINVEFIRHAINAEKPRLLLERRGVRQKNLSLGKIKEISVPLPMPETQRYVVEQLRKVASETQRLESLYQRKLAALDELKQSLLHQAFSGKL